MARRMRVRLSLLVLVVASRSFSGPCCRWARRRTRRPGQLQKKIDRNNSLIGGHKARERVLTSDISSQTRRINALQSDITRLSTRQQRLQTSLEAKRAELATVQRRLRQERARLTRLRARLLVVRRALASRLIELYKADPPDVVTVVLESDGFEDLLTRTEFMTRVSKQDAKIMDIVSDAKLDATATEERLDRLERREKRVAAQIESERDEVSAVRVGLVDRRDRVASARSTKFTLLRQLARPPSRARGRRRGAARGAGPDPGQAGRLLGAGGRGPDQARPGGMIWPVNGPITSPFCERRSWESCHPGIDIGVPAGTPIRAAAAGRVVLIQSAGVSGGYGNFTCVQHGGALSTCYAHQSRFGTSIGRERQPGAGDRLRRLHRPLLRGPPALRDPDQRRRREPDELPVGRR